MRQGVSRRESFDLSREAGQKSFDVSKGRKQRQAEREAEITHEKRRKMARDDDSLKQAMAFTKGWINVSGLPIVACEPLASIEVCFITNFTSVGTLLPFIISRQRQGL